MHDITKWERADRSPANCGVHVSRERAERLLSIHALSAADSLQLAAALVALEEKTSGFEFVTLDESLAEAAAREGFSAAGAKL